MNALILVVEDDIAILKVLQRSLTFEGYQVDTAEDGETALVSMQNHHPDLVILDLMLPVMDGIEVCRRIRVSDKVPILILTARDSVKDRVTGLDAGADDYLVKPFELDELLARVRERGTVELDYRSTDVRVTGRVSPPLAAELEAMAVRWRESRRQDGRRPGAD